MTDLVAQLRAALDEDERVARAATPGPWSPVAVVYGPPDQGWGEPSNYEVENADGASVVSHQTYEGGGSGKEDATHIARHDPARVLRQVAATRKILELHQITNLPPDGKHWRLGAWLCVVCSPWQEGEQVYDDGAACPTLLTLATAYEIHGSGDGGP